VTFETTSAETPGPGERAGAALAGSRFADVRWVAGTGSTNADAMALARDGEPEGIVLVADHQTAGRGRLGRTWEAPPGASLLTSVLLRPPAAVADAVTMATGIAMADAVAAVAGVEARLKWPNDLVVDVRGSDRKLAGILAEVDWPARSTVSGGWSAPPPTERVAVVVGIGVNVNWPAEVPADLADLLVACNHVAGHDVDRVDLLVAFLRGLEGRYDRLRADPAADRSWLRDEWRARAATLGRRVRVDLGADDLHGVAVDIDDAGRLVVETDEGERRALAVGDVVHLR
jgi:BirA family biotin operon repressor/biotin-[acetyl-CoA-carboxylase] ligase